jgi:hypothetical protein
MRPTLTSAVVALALIPPPASGQDDPVLGNWRGTLASTDGVESPLILSIVKRADRYAGTTTGLRESSEVPLTRVAVDGTRVSFEAAAESRLGDLTLTGDLMVEGNAMKGDGALRVGTQRFPLKLSLQRRSRTDVLQPQVEQRADYFVGRWTFEYVGAEIPPVSLGTRSGTAAFTRTGSAGFVAGEVSSGVAGQSDADSVLIGVDPATKMVVLRERRPGGVELVSLGNWQSPLAISLQTSPVVAGGTTYEFRRVISITSEATFSIVEEISINGGPLRRLGRGHFRRIE